MTSVAGRIHTLPEAPDSYNRENESEFRAAVEQGLQGSHSQLANLIEDHTHPASDIVQPFASLKVSGAANIGADADPAASAVLDLSQQTAKGFLPPKLTTAQRDAISSPAAGLLIYNTSNTRYEFYNGGGWAALGGGDTLLARTLYNPTTPAAPVLGTSLNVIDGTNLVVTFVAPTSGNVRIVLRSGFTTSVNTGYNFEAWWGLRENTTEIALHRAVRLSDTGTPSITMAFDLRRRQAVEFYLTGLTPGSSHTYKWTGKVDSTNGNANLYYGGTATSGYGPAIMEVWEA